MKKDKSISKNSVRKLTAKEWETTFDAITDLISIHDGDFRIVKANKAFANTFGTIPEKLVGRKCYEIVHGSKEPWPDCPHRKAIMGSTPVKEEFLEPQLGKCLLVSCSPIFSNGNTVKGTVHIVKDVTERRRVEEALQKARDVLEIERGGKDSRVGESQRSFAGRNS